MNKAFQELRGLSLGALRQEIVSCRKTLFHMRFQKKLAGQDDVKAHEIRSCRRKIARLKTALGAFHGEAPQKASHKASASKISQELEAPKV